MGELTSQSIAGSRIVRFEDSGHAMLFDEPEKFNEELLTFLDGMKMEYDPLNSVEPQRSL